MRPSGRVSKDALGLFQAADASVERQDVAFERASAKANVTAIARRMTGVFRRAMVKKLNPDRLARIGGTDEAGGHRFDAFGFTWSEALQDRSAGEAQGVETMRDRALEAGASRYLGIGVGGAVGAAPPGGEPPGLARGRGNHRGRPP